jgi:hypothetical protein
LQGDSRHHLQRRLNLSVIHQSNKIEVGSLDDHESRVAYKLFLSATWVGQGKVASPKCPKENSVILIKTIVSDFAMLTKTNLTQDLCFEYTEQQTLLTQKHSHSIHHPLGARPPSPRPPPPCYKHQGLIFNTRMT